MSASSTGRQRPGLRAPFEGDGAALPRVPADGRWHRCIDARFDQPWWFSTRTGNPAPGRFDLERPDGTCYLAATPVAAIIERVADPEVAEPIRPTLDELRRLVVWSGELAGPPEVGDTTTASLPRLTGEIDTIVPYDLPWQWADAIHDAGAGGVLYHARFGRDLAVALFGPASEGGTRPPASGDLEPADAVAYLSALPTQLQPTSVGHRGDFTSGPAPR